jgi:hypothetical protein
VHDPRPDELLEEAGRIASRLRLAIGWTDGIKGAAAKACSRSGRGAWKEAEVISGDEGFAAAFFAERARRRNPAVVASRSRLVLVELDLAVPGDVIPTLAEVQARAGALLGRLGIALPSTVVVQSRRGLHFYFKPDAGCRPAKVQISEEGDSTVWSEDGYLVGVPALHEVAGVVYSYAELNGGIETLPHEAYSRLAALGLEEQAETRRRFETGEPLPVGQRNDGMFSLALILVRDGVPEAEALERLRQVNREQCQPPLDDRLVTKALHGAVKWSRQHPTETELARAEARRLLQAGHEGEQEHRPRQERPKGKRDERELRVRPLASVRSRPVRWLVDGMIPAGALTLVAGEGGRGKSTWLTSVAALVTRGQLGEAGSVLVVSYEDPAELVLRPRLLAAGADLDLVHEVYVALDGIEGVEGVVLPSDLPALERQVAATSARMVVIDPVVAAVDLALDAHRDQHVRHVLAQLTAMAERHDCAIPLVGHLNKAPTADAYLRVGNSVAFWNASRSVVLLTGDPSSDDEDLRLVVQRKANWARTRAAQRWRLESVVVEDSGHLLETSRIVFVEDAHDIDPETVLVSGRAEREEHKIEKAISFLESALADGGWHEREGLTKLAGSLRIGERTLQRAALDTLQVDHERRGFPSTTWWRLPQSCQGYSQSVGTTGDPA